MPTAKANRVIIRLDTMSPQNWDNPINISGSASFHGTSYCPWSYNSQSMRVQVGKWIIMFDNNYRLL